MTPDVENIVRNHYDPAASHEANQPLFMVKTHSRDANHTIELLDAYEFAEWLKKSYGRSLKVREIYAALPL